MAGAGLAAAAAAGIFGVRAFRERPENVNTGTGERRALTLSDRSRVTADAHSALTAAYGGDRREVELHKGRAYFEVAKDAARPFRVIAGTRTVTALGTAFTVEMRDGKVAVTLVEGRIAIGDMRAPSRATIDDLRPFEQQVFAGDGDVGTRTMLDAGRALGWREGKLFFDDEPLAAAAARMNDYSNERISVTGPAATLRINGMFMAGQTDAFVEALQTYYGVTADRDGDGITLRLRV